MERPEGRLRGGRLGRPAAGSLSSPRAELADHDLDHEVALVVRPDERQEAVGGMRQGARMDDLLEPVLGALECVGGDRPFQLRAKEGLEPGARGLQPEGQVDGADQRLERGREDGRSPARSDALRTLAEMEGTAEADPARDPGEPGGADDGGAAGRELALVRIGIALVEGL